jgi:protein involved in polysaccharide export with SLBB domain
LQPGLTPQVQNLAQAPLQPIGFQAEVAPQPRALPEPNPFPPEPPVKKPETESEPKDKEAGEKTASAAQSSAPPAPPPTEQAPPPKGIAHRCNACSWVSRCFVKEVPVRDAPKEMRLATSPAYVIRPPDILLVEAPRALPDQPIGGEHLVRADGTIGLGLYGNVRVTGMTVEQAKKAIEEHLTAYLREPVVNVDVYSYNNSFYYIAYDGAGFGEALVRFSYTGNETVLDAISVLGGIPTVGSKHKIWIARPSPTDPKCSTILPVDWEAIVKCGETATNYQLFPGDRLYIQSERLQAFDGLVAKIIAPLERVMGLTQLTGNAVFKWQNMGRTPGFGASTPVIQASGGGVGF